MNTALKREIDARRRLEVELAQKDEQIRFAAIALKKARAEVFMYRQPLDTLLRRKTDELMQAKSNAVQENLAHTEFLANFSHDLMTPLQGILDCATSGISKIENFDKEALLQYFSQIRDRSEQVQSQLSEVQKLSELESGNVAYHFQDEAMSSLVQKVIDEFSVESKEKGVDIRFCTSIFDDTAEMDREKIILVIRNLIANSIKHSEAGSTVTLEICDQKRNLSFSVIDRSRGLEEEELDTVFDKFIPKDEENDNLALAITKEIIADHNGEIWAENNPDGGTILSFIIPKKHEGMC
ncbi:MAG: hypothetical protein COB67_05765 [SAR324 cluster bacterium]|uniref:histidine kinase n=1 Tax=SAR324 cluster bacterium TaxID=2024889 RepID=A0A2A4T594_9DELT|nr:MAG: hypothetical protein COB67_05765 [SAR324 cluster bacterium]